MLRVAVVIVQIEGRSLYCEKKALHGREIENETCLLQGSVILLIVAIIIAYYYKVKRRKIAVKAMVSLPVS